LALVIAFCLLAPNDDTKVRIKILDATLFITQVELKLPLLFAHANVLAKKRQARYPVTHTQIKTLTASSGVAFQRCLGRAVAVGAGNLVVINVQCTL
jgi:hypothetical protein